MNEFKVLSIPYGLAKVLIWKYRQYLPKAIIVYSLQDKN